LRGLPCSVLHSLLEQHWLVPHALFHGIQFLKCAQAHEDSVPCTHGTACCAICPNGAYIVEGNAVIGCVRTRAELSWTTGGRQYGAACTLLHAARGHSRYSTGSEPYWGRRQVRRQVPAGTRLHPAAASR
jgi:hypothetical protein